MCIKCDHLEQLAHRVRLLSIRRAVAVSVAGHEIGARLHQFPVEGDSVLVLRVGHPWRRHVASLNAARVVTRQAAAPRPGRRFIAAQRVLRDHTLFARNEHVRLEARQDVAHEMLAQRQLARQEPQRDHVVRQRDHVMVELCIIRHN